MAADRHSEGTSRATRGGSSGLDRILTDVRVAWRTLLRQRGFSALVALTLSVGIGATAATFTLVQAVLLTPLPYPDADRIVRVAVGALPRTGLDELPFSVAGYWHFANNQRSYESFGAYSGPSRRWRVPLLGDGAPREVTRMSIQVRALHVLGVTPRLGRLPTLEEESRIPAAPVVLLSHGLWVDHFGADPTIVGRTIQLRDWSPEVIGIMPRGFDFPTPEVDVWTLRRLDPESGDVGEHSLLAIGRLAPGVTVDEATVEAEALIARFDELPYGAERLAGLFSGRVSVRPLRDEVIGTSRTPLLIALGTAALVLLLACTNVATLLLVRSSATARERSVRIALGCRASDLVRYALTESALLTVLGALGGVCVAVLGTRVLIGAAPADIPRLDAVEVDGAVWVVTPLIAVGSGLFFGLFPAAGTFSERTFAVLRTEGAGSSIGRGRKRAFSALVVAQMALAFTLLTGSGLLIRSFARLHTVDPGFEPAGVMTLELTPPFSGRYRGPAGVEFGQFYHPLLERLAALPGVESVGATSSLPLTGVVGEPGSTLGPLQIDDFPVPEGELRPNFLVKRTAPGYFETMGIPIVAGRAFDTRDYSPDYSETAFVISASVKRRYWPNESALGKRLTWGRLNGPVVGVAADVRHRGLRFPADEIIHSAQIGRTQSLVVRTAGDAAVLVPLVRSTVSVLDPDIRVARVRSMSDIVGASTSRLSFTTVLLTVAGAISLLLAAVGTYGVVAFVAARQAMELGVRVAVGAGPSDVRNLVIRRGLLLAGAGIAAGAACAVPLSALLGSLLYDVGPLDPSALVWACLVLAAVAVGASLVPAVSAARGSPTAALRHDR